VVAPKGSIDAGADGLNQGSALDLLRSAPEQLARKKEHMVHELATMKEALALGDITAVEDDVSLLLTDFQINLDRKSASYRELGMQALRAYVRSAASD
jgi:hypothetical protein